jgi:hypothetical protein
MNAILEALVGIVVFTVIIAFTTSNVQNIFLANAQTALYESLKQRGYAISSLIKLWLETTPNSIEVIRMMNKKEFESIFIYGGLKEDVAYYVKISAVAEVSGFFSSYVIKKPSLTVEKGNNEIGNRVIRVIDIAKVCNTIWLIEVYLWVE